MEKRIVKLTLVALYSAICLGCKDTSKPVDQPPSSFNLSVEIISEGTVEISWTQSIDPESADVTYDLLLDDAPILYETSDLKHILTRLDSDSNGNCCFSDHDYRVKVIAKDPKGNRAEKESRFRLSEFGLIEKYHGFSVAHFIWHKVKIENKDVTYNISWDDKLVAQNTSDTSIIIRDIPVNTTSGMGSKHTLRIQAKNEGGIKTLDHEFLSSLLYRIPDDSIKILTYNISDDSISLFVIANLTLDFAPPYLPPITTAISLNDQIQYYKNGCSYPPGGKFSDLTDLTQNTTYKITATVYFYQNPPSDPKYETIPYLSSNSKYVTTYPDPIPGQLGINVSDITSSGATVHWRVRVIGLDCYPGISKETIKVYLNNSLITTLNALNGDIYQFAGLIPKTNYEVKVIYEHQWGNSYQYSSPPQTATAQFSTP